MIISTLPHFLCIIPIQEKRYKRYKYVIILSTILSILYHTDESFMIIDHFVAFIWFLYDVYLTYKFTYKPIYVNVLSFIICIIANEKYHSLWHIINSCKCYYVSSILRSIPY